MCLITNNKIYFGSSKIYLKMYPVSFPLVHYMINIKSISEDILTSSLLEQSRNSKDCKCKISLLP